MSFRNDVETIMRSESAIFVYAFAALVLLVGFVVFAYFYWAVATISLLVLSGIVAVWLLCRWILRLVTGGR